MSDSSLVSLCLCVCVCVSAQIITVELLKEEESEIVQIIERSPTIVVFGQNAYVKSRIVNELFGKVVLPPLEDETSSHTRQRMVRFKHGDTATASLTLADDYDLLDTLEADNGPWNTIPQRDLVVLDSDVGSGGDYARGIACLEVTQNHPLLRFGTNVVVAPSVPEGLTEDIVKKCIDQVPSILLYGFASEQLYDKVCILKYISCHVANSIFVCVCVCVCVTAYIDKWERAGLLLSFNRH